MPDRRCHRWPAWLLLPLAISLSSGRTLASDTFLKACAQQLPSPQVTVSTVALDPRLDTAHTLAELNRFKPVPPPTIRLGLTQAFPHPKILVRMRTFQQGGTGPICGSPQVSISVDLNPVTVYVAAEFAERSCAYQAIYAHELKHVEVNRQFIFWTQQDLAADVATYIGRDLRIGDSQSAMQAEVDRLARLYVNSRVREWVANLDTVQRQVDTPAEYARVAALCPEFSRLHRPAHW